MVGKKRSPEEDVKKLTRTELLEMLIEETKEADRLRIQNEKLEAELSRCRADLERTGSLEVILQRLEKMVGGPSRTESDV